MFWKPKKTQPTNQPTNTTTPNHLETKDYKKILENYKKTPPTHPKQQAKTTGQISVPIWLWFIIIAVVVKLFSLALSDDQKPQQQILAPVVPQPPPIRVQQPGYYQNPVGNPMTDRFIQEVRKNTIWTKCHNDPNESICEANLRQQFAEEDRRYPPH